MIDTNVNVYDDSQSFETPREKNHGAIFPSIQVMLEYDLLKCQKNNTTHRTGQKIPPYGKEYLCFQIDGKTVRAAHFSKSLAFTKLIDSII